jgi:AAA domain
MEGAIVPIKTPKPSTAPSFSIFGVSGMGKSSVVERILSFYPQALNHEDHRFLQLVWLKIDCPLDGSLKQLLLSIVAQIDRILGTSHGDEVTSRDGVDKLVLQVAKIAVQHHLGVLVIDEIQNLLDAPGVGLSKMLNFFVTLANEVKVPFVTVGTPKAERLLKTMFREARRVGDKGTINWDRMKLGQEWDYFIGFLWPFQWTAKPTPLTDGLSEKLFAETQGITALAVRLYQLVQLEAIRSEKEVITKGLISKVASENFSLLKNALDALRKGKVSDIAAFEDFFDRCVDEIDEKLNDVSLQRTSTVPDANKANAKKAKDRLKGNLVDFGVPEKRAAAIAAEHYSHPNVDHSLVQEISEWVANESVSLSLLAVSKKAKASGSDVVSAFEGAGLLIRE